ncbi:MAG: sigma-70 family RNA polymerase sigma factor [Phycisphaerae bacterium]|jgi:RNA polymerase sigma factor (sigma-70 family)
MAGEEKFSKDNVALAADIFEKHGDFIYGIIRYKTSDPSLVDDLYQDFFLSLAANPVPLEGPKLRAYLYRSIINDIRDATRRVKRYSNLLEKYTKNSNLPINKREFKNAISSEDRIDEIIRKAWELLSPNEITAISLRYLKDYSIKEVSEKMKVKPATVSRYICVGLSKLRMCLNHKSE